MNGDKLVRRTGYLAVFAVSSVAAWISYWHAVEVVGKHGEPGASGHLYPATIDGLIIAASMVLLDSARNREKPPRLAWWLVGAGIIATLMANVLDGISFGLLGSIIAAWPAAAFVGAYEMIMVLIRSGARRTVPAQSEPAPPVPAAPAVAVPLRENAADPPWTPAEFPRLQETLQKAPPWEDPSWVVPARHAPPASPEPETASHPLEYAGTVSVRSPLARLDRKLPVDERVSRTGSFPAIKD